MPQFAYEARDEDGQLTAGLINATSMTEAGRLLCQKNLFVVRLGSEDTETRSGVRETVAPGHGTRPQVAWCMSQLSIMVETGICLSDALEHLTRQASHPRLKMMLEQISRSVHEGKSLSEALAMYPQAFPRSMTAMIRAAEMSGTLTQMLKRSAAFMMDELRIRKQVRGALMYPLFMLTVCLGVTVFLLTVILPRFAEIFQTRGALLPSPTRMLLGLSELLVAQWALLLGGAALVTVGGLMWMRTAMGRRQRDHVLLHGPLIGPLTNAYCLSRAFRTMGTLLSAGVALVDVVRIVQEIVPNTYHRELWEEIDHQICHGERVARPLLESEIVPEPVSHMIDTGDKAGKLAMVFERLADHIEEEYNQGIKALMQFLEPCMILVMGSIIGFIAASLMLPLFQAGQVVAQ